MKIVFMGTPEFAIPSLEKLLENNFDVILVVTQPDRPQGRKRKLIPSPVKTFALKHNIEVYQPYSIKDDVDKIFDLKPDLIITAAYGQILPKELINKIPAINVHGSLLPAYRGGAPIQYALFDGLEETGVTIMDMAYKMDSGDIIKQTVVKINEDDNYETLSYKMSLVGAELLIDVLNNDYKRTKQDEALVTYAYTIKREDEFIDFYDTASNTINRLRGLLPNPAATFIVKGNRFKVYKMKKNDIISSNPGEIILNKNEMFIQTKTNNIEILEIQAPGKRVMPIRDFLNGQTIIENKDKIERRK